MSLAESMCIECHKSDKREALLFEARLGNSSNFFIRIPRRWEGSEIMLRCRTALSVLMAPLRPPGRACSIQWRGNATQSLQACTKMVETDCISPPTLVKLLADLSRSETAWIQGKRALKIAHVFLRP